MITGADYSFSRPPISALRDAGVRFVCRYLAPASPATAPKILEASELVSLRGAGIALVLVWEGDATDAAGGRSAGVEDARAALAQATALGMPDAVIYYAVDFDATSGDLGPSGSVRQYAAGWASVLGAARCGVYGGYATVAAIMGASLARYGWQTTAWSAGRWYGPAQLRQGAEGSIAGASIDWDTALTSDYGQWPRPAAMIDTEDEDMPQQIQGIIPAGTQPICVASPAGAAWSAYPDTALHLSYDHIQAVGSPPPATVRVATWTSGAKGPRIQTVSVPVGPATTLQIPGALAVSLQTQEPGVGWAIERGSW